MTAQTDQTTPDQSENIIPDEALQAEQESLDSLAAALKQATSDVPEEEVVATRVSELEAENAELKDRLLRAAAETENIRKRSERTQQETSKFAVTGFAKDLISVFENLTRATASIPEEARQGNEAVSNLAVGVEMTLKELETVFGKHGIKRIDPMGEKFDHNYHQAMLKVETDEYEKGTIVQVLQAGYAMHERLLQPAMVGVAKPLNAPSSDTATHVDTQA